MNFTSDTKTIRVAKHPCGMFGEPGRTQAMEGSRRAKNSNLQKEEVNPTNSMTICGRKWPVSREHREGSESWVSCFLEQ